MRFAALALLISTVALADEPAVAVQTEIVHAQLKAGAVDPGLKEMQTELAKGRKYGTLKRLSTQKLTIQTKAAMVALPDGKQAELSVVTLVEGVATIKIKVPGLVESTSKLGRDRSLYQQAGEWQGGDIWLVLSQPK